MSGEVSDELFVLLLLLFWLSRSVFTCMGTLVVVVAVDGCSLPMLLLAPAAFSLSNSDE